MRNTYFIQYDADVYEVPKDVPHKIASRLLNQGLAQVIAEPKDELNQVIIDLEKTSCCGCYKTDTNLYFLLRPNPLKGPPRHILFTYCQDCITEISLKHLSKHG